MRGVLFATLVAGSPSPADAPPDYIGTLRSSFGEPAAVVRSHQGAVRFDFPRQDGEVRSEYHTPGRAAVVTIVRKRTGEVARLTIAQGDGSAAADWEDLGQERTLAGASCRMQRRSGRPDLGSQRCVTADGIILMPRPEGRPLPIEMESLARRRVAAEDVTPPLEWVDLRRWVPPEALADSAQRPAGHDYVATFPDGETMRRSGPWTSVTFSYREPASIVLNDEARLEVVVNEGTRPALWIERSAPGDQFGWFGFKPALVNGKAGETLFGEMCQWRARPTTPDATEFQCRAEDGAVLAMGMYAMGGLSWRPATTFQRQRVPLTSVLPDAQHFTPGYYGLKTLVRSPSAGHRLRDHKDGSRPLLTLETSALRSWR